MNRFECIGRISKDIELTTTQSGVSVAKFSIAVNRKVDKETADFFNICAWRERGELIHKYCRKGSKIFIAGELQNRSYEAQDGTKRYVTEIIVSEFEFLDNKNNAAQNETMPEQNQTDLKPINDDDLPF